MRLSKSTTETLKNFSTINSNLVIKRGTKIETISPSKDVYAQFDGEDDFDEDVAIFNLNELLGVTSSFESPELDLGAKSMVIKQGKQKVTYNYADESLLIKPPAKSINFPTADITFSLSESSLNKLQKMSAILSAEDFAVIGDGKKITLKIYDKKNSACNEFELDVDSATKEKFHINFKIDKLKLLPGNYNVEISKKNISKFSHDSLSLFYYIALETDSSFT